MAYNDPCDESASSPRYRQTTGRTHLNFHCPQVFAHVVRRCLMPGRKACCLFLLFDAQSGLCACEVVALELPE